MFSEDCRASWFIARPWATAHANSAPKLSYARTQFRPARHLPSSGNGLIPPNAPAHAPRRQRRAHGRLAADTGGKWQGRRRGDVNDSSRERSEIGKLYKNSECPHEDCGKRYSLVRHLYHNSKQIYHCDYPDRDRSFARRDLVEFLAQTEVLTTGTCTLAMDQTHAYAKDDFGVWRSEDKAFVRTVYIRPFRWNITWNQTCTWVLAQ
ncbi:C2H2 finger domain-containing protein [Paraphaeosphaeria minitans]|uniref:C2H2 finger domain-containing protein n=1 Tax=Paraphaeosphaeria minitans TaxID=565426 RepID=A0A9P6G4F9_9PLEO|nr:C2H2 finger domain-containing protein [Paraphaeosphaeria minitans]